MKHATARIAHVVILYLVFATSASIAADGCANSATQLEQVQCTGRRVKELDRELNEVYKSALAALPEKSEQDSRKEREQLRKSQRAWLKFKDENCALIGAIEGGSNLSVTHIAARCEAEMLGARIQFLRGIVNDKL